MHRDRAYSVQVRMLLGKKIHPKKALLDLILTFIGISLLTNLITLLDELRIWVFSTYADMLFASLLLADLFYKSAEKGASINFLFVLSAIFRV